MLKSIFIQSLRRILNDKIILTINVAGLSLCCALVILTSIFAYHELSYDRFENNGRTYRLDLVGLGKTVVDSKGFLSKWTKIDNDRITSLPPDLASEIRTTFPEIVSTCRILNPKRFTLGNKENRINSDKVLVADSSFFNVLPYKFISGNPSKALLLPDNIVLTESLSRSLFNEANALERIVELYFDGYYKSFKVSGIISDVPPNSSLQFSAVLPFHYDKRFDALPKGNLNFLFTMMVFKTSQTSDIKELNEKLTKFGRNYFSESLKAKGVKSDDFFLRAIPYRDTHLDNIAFGWPGVNSKSNVYLIIIISIAIIIVTGINYAVIEITRGVARAREIGIRKSLGGNKFTIFLHFWSDAFTLTFVSMVFGFAIAYQFLPSFAQVINSPLLFETVNIFYLAVTLFVLAIVLSLMASASIAVFLIRFSSFQLLRTSQTRTIKPTFSRAIVFVQYFICFVFIFSSFIIREQLKFIENKDLGFDHEGIAIIDLFENKGYSNSKKAVTYFRNATASMSEVEMLSGGNNFGNASIHFINDEEVGDFPVYRFSGEFDYPALLHLKIMEGRFPSQDIPSDTTGPGVIVLNTTLAKKLNGKYKIGQPCKYLENAIVIGVMQDFNFQSLTQRIEPAFFKVGYSEFSDILIRIPPGSHQVSRQKIEALWKTYSDGNPVILKWFDEIIESNYKSQKQWETIISLSSILAIFISCIGLFGLTGLNTQNRKNEMAIRKIFGAGFRHIFVSLNAGVLILVILASLIATPLVIYYMDNWLSYFEFRTEIGPRLFITPFVICLLIVVLTTVYYSIKSFTTNTVKTLRNE